jgi:uncharacterized protein YdiU (UPF0061 family)
MTGWNLEHTYTGLPELFYRRQKPAVVRKPGIAVFNQALARSLGLGMNDAETAADYLTGSVLPPGAEPIAQAYAGYQFGHFAMLGDGRAVLLGEQIAPDGRRMDIQFKGSGQTPFSRRGDGLAALAPMLREYIISEAMFHMGIPTTRSLAVAHTGEAVMRETALPGAVLTRVASSHIRVGTFSFAAAYGSLEDVRALADYSIARHYAHLEDQEEKYLSFFREAARRQASLIAQWQAAGFVHGVMNTDNMAISGETIDYGPCAFLDTYNPDTVFSSIDTAGRYAFKNQPKIGAWNLLTLADALMPLLHGNPETAKERAREVIADYWVWHNQHWLSEMRGKLGLSGGEGDAAAIANLLEDMERKGMDYTQTLRSLSGCSPAVIPRNHRVEEALAAAEKGNLTVMDNLLEALRKPYEDSETYGSPPAPSACRYRTFCGT